MRQTFTRREFALGVTAVSAERVAGAKERLRLGFIGVGNRGAQLLSATLPNEDVQVVALCDVYRPHLDKWAARVEGAQTYGDFRRLLERDDIDAVVIATPDHWHALQTIMACDAKKDVYVEKPLSLTIHEGRRMVEAARKNNRVVQVGLQRRSSSVYTQLAQLVQSGAVGKVTVARAYRINNMAPDGIGVSPDTAPPADLDWEMWLGPRPKRLYNPNIAPYKFRWWQSYSSQLGNWGVHYFDTLRWLLGETAPASVSAHGGKFAVQDARDIPDTLETIYEFASGCLLLFGQYEASGAPIFPQGELELRGTQGVVYADMPGFEIIPERGGQFQTPEPRREPLKVTGRRENLDALHLRNFFDCVKSRKTPHCDVEEGHRSTVFAHLGNIALATKSRLAWDAQREQIVGNAAANALRHYKYRAPWKLD